MWMSKMLAEGNKAETAENGTVTLSTSSSLEAGSTLSTRSIASYSPYGYQTVIPIGEEVLLVPSSDGQVAVGTKSNEAELEAGEVKITSLGGATIILKNDGSVKINSLVIDKEGVIKQ